MAGCIVRQLLFCTFVYTCYASHYNKRLFAYLLTIEKLINQAFILIGKRELIALLNLSSWCLVMVGRLFLAVPRVVCSL